MDRAQGQRSPQLSLSVVVAYFRVPESIQSTLAELQALGLPAHDVRVVNAAAAPTFAGESPVRLGWWQRLRRAARSATGQPQQAPTLRDRMVHPTSELVVVVETMGLPVEAIVAACRRHGASQVHSHRQRQA